MGGGSLQISDKLSPVKKLIKESYISHFKEIQLEDLNLVSIKAKQTILDAIAQVKYSDKSSMQFSDASKFNPLVAPIEPLNL